MISLLYLQTVYLFHEIPGETRHPWSPRCVTHLQEPIFEGVWSGGYSLGTLWTYVADVVEYAISRLFVFFGGKC
jgi:hypothetical protein